MSRILLKLSGEALAGDKHHGFDEATVIEVAKQDFIAKYEFHGKCYRLLNMDPSTND